MREPNRWSQTDTYLEWVHMSAARIRAVEAGNLALRDSLALPPSRGLFVGPRTQPGFGYVRCGDCGSAYDPAVEHACPARLTVNPEETHD